MLLYLARRLVALIPTLFGITLIAFVIINLAPGSPVEQKLQQLRFGSGSDHGGGGAHAGASGVSQEVIDALNRQYGFDKPLPHRYVIWLKNLVRLDFGESFKYEDSAIRVILSKVPVSLQFGVASFLLTYLICIPLGVLKAIKNGSTFDRASSFVLVLGYATPAFMLGILLIVVFGGGSFLDWFPISGVTSDDYASLSFFEKISDRISHAFLPLVCYMVGSFTSLTLLMKNSLLDEIQKDYVRTARVKGLSENVVIYKHALRNALIPIATGFSSFLGVFFFGSLLIEQIFGIDGMGLLSYQSILSRDYNVIMGLLVIESLLFLLGNILTDLLYYFIDPRIDFGEATT